MCSVSSSTFCETSIDHVLVMYNFKYKIAAVKIASYPLMSSFFCLLTFIFIACSPVYGCHFIFLSLWSSMSLRSEVLPFCLYKIWNISMLYIAIRFTTWLYKNHSSICCQYFSVDWEGRNSQKRKRTQKKSCTQPIIKAAPYYYWHSQWFYPLICLKKIKEDTNDSVYKYLGIKTSCQVKHFSKLLYW